jgi:hypothetical protein
MGPAYWIPAFWVPALLVTHYITFVVLLKYWTGDARPGAAAYPPAAGLSRRVRIAETSTGSVRK